MSRVSELSGALLDYWTARAEGTPANRLCFTRLAPDAQPSCTNFVQGDYGGDLARFYRPSTDWTQGGPLIERHGLNISAAYSDHETQSGYAAWSDDLDLDYGETVLQAVCRAVVRSVFGNEVPEDRT